MSVPQTQPQERPTSLLSLPPDVVGAVFCHLKDPRDRLAFFQSHPAVAHASSVLAQAGLRVELDSAASMREWRRILHLARGNPLRSLVIAGPDEEVLSRFMSYVQEGSLEQELLQSLQDLRFEALIRLQADSLSSLMSSMEYHQQRCQCQACYLTTRLVFDLRGRVLRGPLDDNLRLGGALSLCSLSSSRFIIVIKNGTLLLPDESSFFCSGQDVCLSRLSIKSSRSSPCPSLYIQGGRVHAEKCCVEGGRPAAVVVVGQLSSLTAYDTTLKGLVGETGDLSGLWASGGASVCLTRCTSDGNKGFGWMIEGRSVLTATGCSCCVNQNDNLRVEDSRASLAECSLNLSDSGRGLYVSGLRSQVTCRDCTMSGNFFSGVAAFEGATVLLYGVCRSCYAKFSAGWFAKGATIVRSDQCITEGNAGGSVKEMWGGMVLPMR